MFMASRLTATSTPLAKAARGCCFSPRSEKTRSRTRGAYSVLLVRRPLRCGVDWCGSSLSWEPWEGSHTLPRSGYAEHSSAPLRDYGQRIGAHAGTLVGEIIGRVRPGRTAMAA